MTAEVLLHYRPGEADPSRWRAAAREALAPFPARPAPTFRPWFPGRPDARPLKPRRPPPLVPEDAGQARPPAPAPAPRDRALPPRPADPRPRGRPPVRPARRWSVSGPRGAARPAAPPPSEELRRAAAERRLPWCCRARWTIEPSACPRQTLEDVWAQLNRLVRRGELPSCNATIQRPARQIWVFCDLARGEDVGNLLKGRLGLAGEIHLSVRKHGVVFSL